MKRLVSFFSLLITIFCCEIFTHCKAKAKDVVIEGIVFNAFDPAISKVVEGAQVELQFWDPSPKKSRTPCQYITVITDINGKFSIPIKYSTSERHVIRVYKDGFITSEGHEASTSEAMNHIGIVPFAYLKLRIIKTSNSSNKISTDNLFNFSSNKSSPFDTLLPDLKTLGVTELTKITWSITNTSKPLGAQNPNVIEGEVSLKPLDTTLYTIKYD